MGENGSPLCYGVSITCGQHPRTHIWTYACGYSEDNVNINGCPCNTNYTGAWNVASSFISNHYYCESAIDPGETWPLVGILYANDPSVGW